MVKLLVIDDDLPTCNLLKEFFSEKNYQVFIATAREEALAIVKERQPDVILLDIVMPGRLGTDTLQRIKKIDKRIKVVMMTAVKDKEMVELSKQYGASEYITKPFSLEYLEKEVIRKLLK